MLLLPPLKCHSIANCMQYVQVNLQKKYPATEYGEAWHFEWASFTETFYTFANGCAKWNLVHDVGLSFVPSYFRLWFWHFKPLPACLTYLLSDAYCSLFDLPFQIHSHSLAAFRDFNCAHILTYTCNFYMRHFFPIGRIKEEKLKEYKSQKLSQIQLQMLLFLFSSFRILRTQIVQTGPQCARFICVAVWVFYNCTFLFFYFIILIAISFFLCAIFNRCVKRFNTRHQQLNKRKRATFASHNIYCCEKNRYCATIYDYVPFH